MKLNRSKSIVRILFVILLLAVWAQAQTSSQPFSISGIGVPSGSCAAYYYRDNNTGNWYNCVAGTWQSSTAPWGASFLADDPLFLVSGHLSIANPLPVTGTFWQVTQPVSAASLPLPSGAATDRTLASAPFAIRLTDGTAFYKPTTPTDTQPVSMATNTPDVTDRAARLLGHVTVDNASIPVTGTFFQATQPVSGTVSINAIPTGSNVIGHTINDSGSTTVVTGTVTVNNTQQGTASQNVAQFGGTNVSTGAGAGGAGIPRVTVSNDSTVGLIAGVAEIGNVKNSGTFAVQAAQSGTWTDRIVGNAGAAFDAANNAATPANVVVTGMETATQGTTQPAAATAGNVRRPVESTDGAQYVRNGGPVTWSCGLDAIGATLTQCQAAPAAGLKLYITDIVAQSTTTTGGQFGLRFGTGTNCVTGTGNVFPSATATARYASPANTAAPTFIHFIVPLPVTAANAVCVLGVATNTTTIQINGYTAP